MEGAPQPRQRVLPLEEAKRVFALQLQIFPELMDEIVTLSGGRVGIVSAVLEKASDEISYTPDENTTPQRIRELVGAPADDSKLDQWRQDFWTQLKAKQDEASDD